MAWTESCKIDANKQVQHLKGRGMSVRQAIKKLSDESGIPENTINNWIYERKERKKVDAFHHMFDVIHEELIEEGKITRENFYEKLRLNARYAALWVLMWLNLEDEAVFNWYRDAFEKYGKSIRLTDMYRTGLIYCNCPNCDGSIQRHGPLLESALTPAIRDAISSKGYVNFNAIPFDE